MTDRANSQARVSPWRHSVVRLVQLLCAHLLQKALGLRRDQTEAIREAHEHFLARQRALAQQRCQALPLLQKAFYSCSAFASSAPWPRSNAAAQQWQAGS